ncbi:hypothetical protein A2U01_0119057 [Trifolium medium]|uniref:Uncharacterized protein n=1 Tax=Trifolium medium TaxID=97028 RepID=A0A392WC11_9FABA|nr:hypothetical protein [Trifolium medium]
MLYSCKQKNRTDLRTRGWFRTTTFRSSPASEAILPPEPIRPSEVLPLQRPYSLRG